MFDKEIGYYCPNCDKVHASCWEFDNELICSTCFGEGKIKLITIDNFRSHLKVTPLINNALSHFKKIVNKDFTNIYNTRLTPEESEKIISILNVELRKEKLIQISKKFNEK